ncbi:MAG: hypothetical protein A2W91_19640 [Bacteroidetes bacterium GWF2_38_335]|nr:MAG: hypothetical protein A2W91_19640 [Bacteroidetes bacterium GWF2_38_335]OFY79969.1 MAG: hypothetical protein A2281_11040 [Bacteroidetes bacterium RIFOXYA12_FULL_38_20]HBS86429.1 hypothetical protein [Bacteroidales bacterium]
MPEIAYYPKLKRLISVPELPELFSFFSDNVNDLLDQLRYHNLIVSKSPSGDMTYYSVDILTENKIGISIPGTGIKIVLNPPDSLGNQGGSEFKIIIFKRHEVLKFIHEFELETFSFSADDIKNLIFNIFNTNEEDIIQSIISNFVIPSGTIADEFEYIETFINQVNSNLGAGVDFNSLPEDPSFDEVYELIKSTSNIDFIEIVQYYLQNSLTNLEKLFEAWFINYNVENRLKEIIIPEIYAKIKDISIGLEFPRRVLKPLFGSPSGTSPNNGRIIDEEVDVNGNTLIVEVPEDDRLRSFLRFDIGDITFSIINGLQFNNASNITFWWSQIGNTGIDLMFSDMKLDLSRTKNIDEASADGRPNDFIGVFIEKVAIGLPKKWFKQDTLSSNSSGNTLEIYGEKVIIGTGGFSGIIGLRAIGGIPDPEDEIFFRIGGSDTEPEKGFALGFKNFYMKFERNSILESEIIGSITLPDTFKTASEDPFKIDILAHFFEDGDFSITASSESGYTAIIKNVLEIKIFELEVGRVEDEFYLETKAELKILNNVISKYIPDPIQIKRLRIWDDGRIEFSGGGSIVLPEPKTLKVGPLELSITAIHIGSHEQYHGGVMRKYAYIGFDGGINVNPGGVDARGDGVKFYFTIDNNNSGLDLDFFIRIESIAIDLIIPGSATPEAAAVLISGYLSMKEPDATGTNPDQGTEYSGGVSLSLPKANISGSAAMRMNPKVPSFLIDLSLELPVPITLGPTGLGIYGFRGLLGQKYVASKDEIGAYDWWDYYKKKVAPTHKEGIQPEKFAQENGFSVGAGASISTIEPSGDKKAFTSKIFFLLSLPDVLLIQGQAAIIKERIGLDCTSDPPFSAMLAIDSTSITTAFGVNYKIPETNGKILQLDALLAMGFFYHDSDAWYINIGTKEHPVQGKIFKDIFNINAYSYLQLYSGGIDAGAGISFYKKAKAGPLSAELSAYIDVFGKINFVPVQIGAGLNLGGSVSLKIWKFGLTLSAAASIAAEIPKPFVVSGSVKACIRVLKKDRCISFAFTWVIDNNANIDEILLHQIGSGATAINVMSNETFPLYSFISPSGTIPPSLTIPEEIIIPVDSKIEIEFLKPVDTTNTDNFGSESTTLPKNTEQVPKKKGKLEPTTHTFKIEEVSLFYKDGSTWQPYNVFEAITPDDPNIIVTPPLNPNYGYWQRDSAGKVNKLSILGRSPLEWLRNGSTLPDLGLFNINTQSAIYCPNEALNPVCINFDNYPNPQVPINTITNHDGMWFKLVGTEGSVSPITNPFGLTNALILAPGNTLEIYFQNPVALTKLRLLTKTPSVSVSYFKRIDTGTFDINNISIYTYSLIVSNSVPLSGLILPVEYEDENNPVDKIVIEPDGSCLINCLEFQSQMEVYVNEAILELQDQISILTDEISDHQFYCETSPDPMFANQSCVLANMKTQQIEEIQNLIELLSEYSLTSFSCYILQEDGSKILFEDSTDKILLEEQTCCSGIYPCGTYVFGVCWQNLTEYYVPDISEWTETYESVTAMIEAMSRTVEPIWRPNGTYLIRIKSRDSVTGGGNADYEEYYFYGFNTKGPLGHFHQFDLRPVDSKGYVALESVGREDEYKLSKLKDYIDVARSYPDAEGNIIDAKPLFYKLPKLRMLFKYPYVYTMFSKLANYGSMAPVQTSLNITIKDPQEPEVIPYAEPQWSISQAPITGVDVEVLNNFMNGQNCVQATEFELLNIGLYADLQNLKPLKLYTAIFNVDYNNSYPLNQPVEVHRYNFQTSRYACFREQVLSYLTFEESINLCEEMDLSSATVINEAIYDIVKTFDPADLSEAVNIIANTSANDELVKNFSNKYERILFGALKMQALNKAETTEFNILWYNDGGTPSVERIIGILVRNPEPFNNPKLTDEELEQSIKVVDGAGNEDANYKIVLSKDKSEAFISNTSLNIDVEDINIRFRYLEYDEATGTNILLNPMNEVVVNIAIIAPTTKLCAADCGSVEVDLRNTLTADSVPNAYAYEFLIENTSIGYSALYLRNNADGKLPLYEIVDLKYNTQYTVRVRPLISGRRTIFGNSCSISTKTLTFSIINPADTYVGIAQTVTIKVIDLNGNTITNYNENVTLNVSGNASGAGLVDIINGKGSILINDNFAEVVTLSLTDSELTGILLGPDQDLEFHAIVASKLVILDPVDAEQGESVQITIHAQNVIGLLDTLFNGTVTLISNSANTTIDNSGLVNIINGIGTINLTNSEAETIILSLADSGSTGLDVSSNQDLNFTTQGATKFVIIDPVDSSEGTYVTVVVQAQNDFGDVDYGYNQDVKLIATGSGPVIVENSGLVNIQNGEGSIQVFSDIPQTVTLTLEDIESTGLNVIDAIQYLVFVMIEGVAFKDTFTEASGITLENHLPDIGDSWTKIIQIGSATMKVDAQNDTLTPGTNGLNIGVLYTADVGTEYTNADYIVEMKQIQGGVSDFVNYLAARIQDNGNMYIVQFNKSASRLIKKIGTNWVTLISGSGTSDGAVVKFEVLGNKLRFYENYENDLLFFIDNEISGAGKAGAGMGNIGTGGNLIMQEFDSFIVRWGGDLKRIFLDKFTNSGLLDNNIPEEGDGWLQVINVGNSDGIKIQNGVARKTSNGQKNGRGSFYVANNPAKYTTNNYEVELTVLSGHNSDNTISMGVRVQNNGLDGYFVRINNSESRLYKRVNGAWAALGTLIGSGVPNGSVVILRANESNIEFECNGQILLNESDSTISGIGEGGFGIGAVIISGDVEKNQEVDNFVIRNL